MPSRTKITVSLSDKHRFSRHRSSCVAASSTELAAALCSQSGFTRSSSM